MHVTRTLSYETPDNPPVRGYLVINLEKIFECGVSVLTNAKCLNGSSVMRNQLLVGERGHFLPRGSGFPWA